MPTTKRPFRGYLRTSNVTSEYEIRNLINAAENYLPAFIKQLCGRQCTTPFDDEFPIELLIEFEIQSQLYPSFLTLAQQGWRSLKVTEYLIGFYAHRRGIKLDEIEQTRIRIKNAIITQQEASAEMQRQEGRLAEVRFWSRQRNRTARKDFLKSTGYKCYVCGFDFERKYGELGHEFIEVHHKVPLASYVDVHEIDPNELCALCSNCHSMVHRKKEALDVDELRQIVLSHKD